MNTITGEYRNNIDSLSSLDMKSYERIFKVFKMSVEDKDFYYYSTLKKIEFPEIDSIYLGNYEVETRMPMTIVSYKIYGDIKSWWLIYLLNKEVFGKDAPFYVEGGTEIKYILNEYRTLIYNDITQATLYGNRHF